MRQRCNFNVKLEVAPDSTPVPLYRSIYCERWTTSR